MAVTVQTARRNLQPYQPCGDFEQGQRAVGELMTSGARYEIAVDGTARTHRDTIEGAWAAATTLKTKQPQSEITVRDLQTGTSTTVKHPSSR
jgi:hypothetical protein